MHKGFVILLVLFFVSFQGKAKLFPTENCSLNYRIIGFSFPSAQSTQKGNKYVVEIATGDYNDEASFKKNIIKTVSCSTDRIIIEVPTFGSKYTWRVIFPNTKLDSQDNRLHHFSTATYKNIDTNNIHLRIVKKAVKYKDAFVFLDGDRVLYNMQGQPVWFLPKVDSLDNVDIGTSDIKITPQGTITFISNATRAYEVDYNGSLLWKPPLINMQTTENPDMCHHEFTRLNNGHYMVLGREFIHWKLDSNTHKVIQLEKNDLTGNIVEFGTVKEYDEKGNVVWSWRSSAYYKNLWLQYFDNPHSGYNDVHANAFFFDEKTKNLYVSFKNISQVVKVKYPEGNVINAYGKLTAPDATDTANALFCTQHSCKISQEGYLYLYNNNTCHIDKAPNVLMMQLPRSAKEHLKLIWEYECPVTLVPQRFKTIGGNVTELPDRSMLISLASPYNEIFIVNRDKKVLWQAAFEHRNESDKIKWDALANYRVSIIKSHKELEQLIWNSEK